jgi:hypothetical protein
MPNSFQTTSKFDSWINRQLHSQPGQRVLTPDFAN